MTIARARDTRRRNAQAKVEASIRTRAKEAKAFQAKAKDGTRKEAKAKDGAKRARAKEEFTHWMSGGGREQRNGVHS